MLIRHSNVVWAMTKISINPPQLRIPIRRCCSFVVLAEAILSCFIQDGVKIYSLLIMQELFGWGHSFSTCMLRFVQDVLLYCDNLIALHIVKILHITVETNILIPLHSSYVQGEVVLGNISTTCMTVDPLSNLLIEMLS